MPHEQFNRDTEEKMVNVTERSGDIITGPLGLWPFPVLNIILTSVSEQSRSSTKLKQTKLTVTEVRRDENGRIQAIEEFEK